jgi:hypothetical protein
MQLIAGTTRRQDRPDAEWVRPDPCPLCGEEVVNCAYYIGGNKGYLIVWECWASLGEDPTCEWRKVL